MKVRLFLIATTLLTLQSCEKYSRGLIVNESNDTILIKLTANYVKNIKVNPGYKQFPSQYFDYFKDSVMIDPHTNWENSVFKGDFKLAPENSFEFAMTNDKFGLQSIHFDTLQIITQHDTLVYKTKKEIFKAFRTTDNIWFYLRIADENK